jgi:hypothetical protein
MNIKEAQAITHTLSKPGKMPGFAYSTPAHECKTGTKLRLFLAAFALIVTPSSVAVIDSKT